MKLAIIGYLPDPSRGHPQAFLDNVRAFKNDMPLTLFSHHPWPDVFQLKMDPAQLKKHHDPRNEKRYFLHNAIFLSALRMARHHGASHMLMLEDDCRVRGDGWADAIFDEAFSSSQPWVVAGSAACYNPSNAGIEAHRRWEQFVKDNVRKNYPIPTYGWLPSDKKHPSCVFVNGALGIYNIAWMERLFDLEKPTEEALKSTAYDMEIGIRLWNIFGVDSYDLVAHLSTSMFSSFGDVLSTEDERLAMLASGQVRAVHQVKSAR